MSDHIDHVERVKKRFEHQVSLSKKKGRTSVDQFLPGDRVIIQDNNSGKWLEVGTTEQMRSADDQSTQSYQIRMENGTLKLRSKGFIKHQTKGDRQVQFDIQGKLDNRRGQTGQMESQPDPADNTESNVSRPNTRSMDSTTV